MTSCRGVILGKTSHVSRVYIVLFSFISGYKNAGSQTKSRLSAGGNMIILQLKKNCFQIRSYHDVLSISLSRRRQCRQERLSWYAS